MVIGLVAACAVLAACGLAFYAVRRARTEAERRLRLVLDRVDRHLDALSIGVEDAIGRVLRAQSERLQPLTLDFDELLDAIVAEAASRTGADAVVLRVEGPNGRPAVATVGAGAQGELGEGTFAPPGARRFRAATIDWTYSASGEPEDEQFRSALVAPLSPAAGTPGTLVAYSTAPNAFRPDHSSVVHELLAQVATGLANARRFAELEARLLLDPETGVANRRGYEVELGREVARARRTGRPLSVVLVGIRNGAETASTAGSSRNVDQFARILTRVTRRSDISCRRGEREFAILLPETRASGASILTSRLREEATRALGATPSTIAVGHVEWRPDETVEALEARVAALAPGPASGSSPGELSLPVPIGRAPAPVAPAVQAHLVETTDALRRDVLEAVARDILAVRPSGRSLAVVALEVDGLDELSERDRESADAALGELVGRLSDSVGAGAVLRLSRGEFVLVLPDATADDGEALVGTLHLSSDADELAGVTLTAGITEMVERDGAQTVLGRAEHALWQARQAGRGTVVVAVPGRRRPRFE